MSRPKKYDERVDLTVRVDPNIKEALQHVADERMISVSLIVNRAIEDLLLRLIPVEEELE